MEGKRERCSSQIELLKKIKEFTRALVDDLRNGWSPVILIDRFRSYCTDLNSKCYCGSDLPCGKEVLTLCSESHVRRLDVMLRVLLIIQRLLQENKHSSKRDIYYMHPSVFLDQSAVDRALNDICVLMECSRHNLNVVSAGKGLVMGWIRFFEGERIFDCISSPNKAYPVPVHVEEVRVFQRLANDQFCNASRCIVLTGRGYPDVPTRRFLRLLVDQLHIPAFCLVDCDPYGFDILTTYRFGSMQMAYDTKYLRVPELRWLGAFPSDAEKFYVPKHCLLSLTVEDKKRIEAMRHRCYLKREVLEWRLELELMLQKGVKFEIEAFSARTLSFLSETYLPSKIQDELKVMHENCIYNGFALEMAFELIAESDRGKKSNLFVLEGRIPWEHCRLI